VIVVVDYGVNNLRSVVRAFEASGHTASLATDPDLVRRGTRVVLPGVGNFSRATHLAASGLADALRDVAASGRPLLGICLGLQLLFTRSEEAPGVAGVGLLEGEVRKFAAGLPVPHVGWSKVDVTAAGRAHAGVNSLFGDEAPFYYHVHSYHPSALPADDVLATAEYGEVFPTLVGRGNVLGAQFHPEKSQQAGLAFLDAFARWDP
jgi:glutamine amidotransferase